MVVTKMLIFILSLALTISTFIFMAISYFTNCKSSKLSDIGSVILFIQYVNEEINNDNKTLKLCVRIFGISLVITALTKWLL